MSVRDLIDNNGFDNVLIFGEPSYESAFLGVTTSGRAVYDYDKMVDFLAKRNSISREDAIDWLECDTILSSRYMGAMAPIIVHILKEET